MRELISISIGQAGVQISSAIWELLCTEHGINESGEVNTVQETLCSSSLAGSMFNENKSGSFTPRALLLDLEPIVIDEIRTGIYHNLFSSEQLISGDEDAASNYARGHTSVGKKHLEDFFNCLRHLCEDCDYLQGLCISHSFGGGTGSGFTALVMENLANEQVKIPKVLLSVLPSNEICNVVVEPYNAILSCSVMNNLVDLNFSFDNKSLYDIVSRKLKLPCPTMNNVNKLLAQVYSNITVSLRHENSLNNDIYQIITNLVPFPRLHYPTCAYSPLCSCSQDMHYLYTTSQITRDALLDENRLLEIEKLEDEQIFCASLQFRGNVSPVEINESITIAKRKNNLKFVDWCPTGFKIGVNRLPPVSPHNSHLYQVDKSVVFLNNFTGIHTKFASLSYRYRILYRKHAYMHWFICEGLEESEFVDAFEETIFMINDYKFINGSDGATIEEIIETDKPLIEPVRNLSFENEVKKRISTRDSDQDNKQSSNN